MRKASPPREIPPPLELECLKVLWTLKEGSVKDVVEKLKEQERRLAYTTVLTVLDRLCRRGAVERRKDGRAFLFAPVLNLERARRTAVRELVDIYFAGSLSDLRAYLDAAPAPPPPEPASEEARLDPTLL